MELHLLTYNTSANGFSAPARGWNAWGMLANKRMVQNQNSVAQQCGALDRGSYMAYCSLDSGWSVGCNGDAHGRLIADSALFPDLPGLSSKLHANGAGLGVYVIPGTFAADGAKLVRGTDIALNSTWMPGVGSKFCRMPFDFARAGVQEWHNSVVDMLCEHYNVSYIKLDYVCPTSSPDGCEGFVDSRNTVRAYHTAIQRSQCRGTMRLGISWMIDWNARYWPSWNCSADSMRLDEDINNSGESMLVSFATVQRAIERYRVFITSLAQGLVNGAAANPVHVRPDMDNMYVANPLELSGLHDAQRYTMAMYWVGAGANLFEGGDLTKTDALGRKLLYDAPVHGVGGVVEDFGNHPMQPRNPHAEPWCEPAWPFTAGGSNPQQLQAWIAGPNSPGDALVILSNLGPDEFPRTGQGKTGTFLTKCDGIRTVHLSFAELGLTSDWDAYVVSVVWDGSVGGRGGGAAVTAVATPELAADLGPWESVMFRLTKKQ